MEGLQEVLVVQVILAAEEGVLQTVVLPELSELQVLVLLLQEEMI